MIQKQKTLFCAALAFTLPFVAAAERPAKPASLEVLITGDAADKSVELTEGPVAILMGGGPEVDRAFQKRAFPVIKGGDVVVLRVGRIGGYNPYFYEDLVSGALQPDSVETIQLDTKEQANSDYVAWAIETAEMVWFAGGDQSQYTSNWRGTRAQTAIQKVWDKGGVVGGTSAGLAILGEFIFDPGDASATDSERSIADPYNSGATISDRFIDIPWLDNVITDTHFRNRDRLGRSLAFMARLREEGRASETIRAICVSENSSLSIGADGIGHVDADEEVYILLERADTQRTQVAPGQPLVYGPVDRLKLEEGDTFDFNTWKLPAPAMPLTVDGRESEPIGPADPYADYEAGSKQSSWVLLGDREPRS